MKFIICIITVFFLAGCMPGSKPKVKPAEVHIGRLDRDVFMLDTVAPDVEGLRKQYGRYFDVYTGGVLQLGEVTEPDFKEIFLFFRNDPVMREVADSVAARYPDMKKQEQELAKAWAYYSYYFPEYTVPEVYTHISGFNQSIIVDSAVVGIGLDNYLGEDCIFYSMLAIPIPVYARRKMTGHDIARDVVTGWLASEFIFRPQTNDLISGMIYQGRIMYVLKKLFPEFPEELLFGYTKDQLIWARNNESQIWGFLIEHDYLFSTQQKLVVKYLNEAPYTSGMPIESPGKVVVWTGYRIVEKYMKKSGVDLKELMLEQDYHKVLRIAGYRP